ncbi:hypothetical protein Slin14017_G119570 [Septoria linicola]|nr:hypothetical protein Slin14017_G119570 [Septoria linicola]
MATTGQAAGPPAPPAALPATNHQLWSALELEAWTSSQPTANGRSGVERGASNAWNRLSPQQQTEIGNAIRLWRQEEEAVDRTAAKIRPPNDSFRRVDTFFRRQLRLDRDRKAEMRAIDQLVAIRGGLPTRNQPRTNGTMMFLHGLGLILTECV